METSQFVVNICTPGGYNSDGSGTITGQKVRLIHAVIRYYIVEHGNWDSEMNNPEAEPRGINKEFVTQTDLFPT